MDEGAPKRLLSVDEAAGRMGRDPSLVRRLIRHGRLPAVRVGERSYAISPEDVDRFAAQPRRAGRPRR